MTTAWGNAKFQPLFNVLQGLMELKPRLVLELSIAPFHVNQVDYNNTQGLSKVILLEEGTEGRFILCKSCSAGPRQGQAEQLRNSRNKIHQTTYKE